MKYLTSTSVQLYFTENLNSQPSSIAALNNPIVKDNLLLKKSAEIIAARLNESNSSQGQVIELEPNFNRGETIRRNKD